MRHGAHRLRAGVVAAVVLCAPAAARAQMSLQLQADPPEPAAGQPFRVVYTVALRGAADVHAQPLQVPRGLDVLMNPPPPQAPQMIGAGAFFTFRSSVTYVLRAARPGRYVIPGPRAVGNDGHVVVQGPPLTVNVTRTGGTSAQARQAPRDPFDDPFPNLLDPMEPPQPAQAPQRPTGPDVPPEGVLTGVTASAEGFVRVVTDLATPWVGQQVEYRAFVYVPAGEAGCEPLREATLDGFWSESLVEARQQCAARWLPQRVGSWDMTAGMVRRIALFPTHAGRLEIGSLKMGVEYIEGDGFFGRRHRVEMEAPRLVLEAREPPLEGRPPGYVPGTLGPIALRAEIDRAELPVGETATLRVHAQGNGYLGSVTLPAPRAVDGVRVLPGSSHAETDRSVAPLRSEVVNEYRIVADRAGRFTLPALRVPWFDPGTGRYAVGEVVLPVIVATGALRPPEDSEGPDLATQLAPLVREVPLASSPAFFTTALRVWGVLGAVPLAVLGAFAGTALRRALRVRRAAKESTARNDPQSLLAQADAALAGGDGVAALGLAARALERASRASGTSSEAKVAEARAACDGLRFAGAAVASDDVAAAVRAVRAVVEGRS